MAALGALHAITNGLAQYLTRMYQLRGVEGLSCTFSDTGTSQFKSLDDQSTTVSIFLYRIAHNEHLRNRAPVAVAGGGAGRMVPLAVNLHLLFSVWADVPLKELQVLAWTMRELHQRPVLDRSVLPPSAGFSTTDQIQLTPEELSLDDMSKLWQMLAPPLRPSITYVARNVPIDIDPAPVFAPVVATRFTVQGDAEEVFKP